ATWEARDNINAGVGEGGFFLATGGETKREPELNATLRAVAAPGAAVARPPADLPAAVWASSAAAVAR
ncbi:MAG: hypothetical protein RLZZ15_4480, partial [Verrucomicrobiota bacterium]